MRMLFLVVLEGSVIMIRVFCFGGEGLRRVLECWDKIEFLVLKEILFILEFLVFLLWLLFCCLEIDGGGRGLFFVLLFKYEDWICDFCRSECSIELIELMFVNVCVL